MISRHLHALMAVISVALTLMMANPANAQLHDVLVEPNNVVYSSTAEIQDGSEHMLVASTVSNGASENSLPTVRISRVKTDGSIDWEKDYAQETGWRAAHVMDIGNETGVLIGITASVTGAATRSIVMTFDLNTGAVLATAEIKENVAANASEKGLVLIHGLYRNGKLALTGWLGGISGVQLNEQRVAVLVEIDVPDASQTSITPNWTHAIDSFNNPDGADYDMGAHVLDVPDIGYFVSGSANAFYENPATNGYHQAPLAALVEYDGTPAWSKVTPYWYPGEGDNEPIVPQNQRHAVASCAAVLNAAGPNNPNQLTLVQTVNWVRNRGLTTLHYHIDGSAVEARGLHLDGAYTNPGAETSLKGYSMYRRLNANSDTEVIIAGYVNDPEYLDSDPDTEEKDRVPFLMAVELTGTVTSDYLIDHTIYAGSPSTNYGDDFGLHAANSQQGQQPIIFHPEMMDLREAALGYGLIGHRRTHDIPTVFDPSIIHVNSAGTDAFGGLPGCIEFTHPMTLEFPEVAPFTPFIEDISLTGDPISMDTSTPNTTPTPCDEYFNCDVSLTYSLVAVNCSTYTITVGNAGSTPMADLDLSFDVDIDGVIEQTGVADGSDGSGNPSFTRAYPEGVITLVEVALNCQGLDYTQIVAINPDCGDDCTPDNDLSAVLTSATYDLCSIEYSLLGNVSPVAGADITWTFNGTAVPTADGQWSPTFNGSVEDVAAAYADGIYTGELCATVICPDGTTNTQCLTFIVTPEAPDYGLDMWLYCGEGCWGGWTGTRAAITFDMALFDLDEADYDAEVCFSDGTTLPINLDMPMSFIKCFSGFTLFKEACLKIYEDGGIASGADPCYEACDRESCITIEPFPFDRIADLIPDLGFNPVTCSFEAVDLPGTIEASTRIMAFSTAFPGGDDAVSFLSQFQNGEDFADVATNLGPSTTLGSYQTALDCGYVLESAILHPVIECPDDTSGPLYWMAAAQAAGPNAIMLGAQLDAQLVSAYIPGDMFTPTGSPIDPDGLDVNFTDLIPIDPTLPGIGYNTWDFFDPGSGLAFETAASSTSEDDCDILQDVPDGFYYDNGVLGAAAFALNGNTSIPITETGQVCLEDYHYLTEVTVEVFNTAALFAQEEEEYPMGEWTPNDGGEDEFPMSEWTPFTYVGAQLLTNATLEPFDAGATAEDLVIDYYDGYGDSSGPWSITDLEGNVVASGAMPTDTNSVSESLALAPGTYTFSWDADCFSAYDNSGLQITLGGLTLVDLPPGTITPGLIETIVDVPGIIIPPLPSFSLDTLCDALFSHDPMALGMLPYSAPGTTIATENAISLGFEQFFDGFGMTYGTASVDAAFPTFGSGHFLWTNNILAAYDLSAFSGVTEVSFEFFDGAGLENLQVNGYTLLTGELEAMVTNVAPGVTMAVTTTAHAGYQTGTVVLTGNVQKLEIGGQQFAVDHICVKHDGQITDDPQDDTTDCDATCDVFTSFESLTVGNRYGDITAGATIAVAPGGLAVTSDGVPVYLDVLQGASGTYFNFLGVESTPFGNVLWTNNLSAEFDIQSVLAETDTVCLAFRDQGGFENLSINGSAPVISPNGYGGLTAFHGAVIGGVLVEVTGTSLGYAFEGTISLIGDVDKFSVGGQELFLDDLCISGADGTVAPDITTVDDTTFLEGLDIQLTSLDADGCQSLLTIDLGIWEDQIDSLGIHLIDADGNVAGSGQNLGGGQFLLSGSSQTPLSISLSVFVLETIPVLVTDLPGLDIPTCDIEIPCFALAAFAAMDIGNCIAEFNYIGTPGILDWTIGGIPVPAGPNFTHPIAQPGQLVCVTVTDFNDPNCTDTYCQYVSVDCGGGTDQVDSCDVEFTHELMAFGPVTIPGPGVTVASEDGIDLSFEDITYVDGSTNFGSAEIMAAQPEAGNGQVLWLNNISAVYDLTGVAAVQQVKFEFIDYGGLENLRINGSLLVDDIDNMGGALGGVNVLVTYNTYFGFIAGEVILTGNVQELAVAGQEFYIDNVCVITGDEEECTDTDADGICDEDEVAGCTDPAAINYDPNATDDDGSCDNGNDNANDTTEVITNFAGSCPSSCDWLVDFGSQPLGTSWGDPASGPTFPLAPGSFMFNEGGVDMYVDALSSSLYGSYYNQNIITTSPWPTFGMGQVLHTNNATVTFDLDSIPTDSVCLDILDLGGFEYLEVNGVGFSSMNGYGQLIAAPMNMGGVQVQVMGNPIVTTTSAGPMVTGFNGRLVLHGNVYKLRIGGQEFWIDNLCISSPPPPPSLPEFVDNEGQDALLDMLDANVESDTSSCVMAVSLDLTDQALPTADEIQVQLIGMETGTVYNSITVEDGGLDGDGMTGPEHPVAAQMPHMVTFDGLYLVNIPETTDGEMMLVSVVLTEGDFVIDLTIPGIFVPGCGGGIVDIPCDVDATFAALETPCGVITVIAAPEPSAVETWTLNGAPYVPIGDPHTFTLTLADGVHTLCRTVTSLLFPNCSDTYCHTFAVDCAVDSCDYSFTHESMAYGPVNTSLTYTEDHIDLHFAPFDDGLGGGPSLGNAHIDYAIPGIGTNQVLLLSNINADYNLTNLVNVSRVTFDYFDGAGIENLMVNGDFIVNEFGSLYGSTFTLGGVDVFITRLSTTTYSHGEVILTGNVQSFAVGGQQFYVDDICVTADGVICTTDSDQDGVCDEDEVAGCTDATAGNYDASATDEDGSCQYYATTDSTEIVIAAGSPCPAECNALVDFESQMLGVSWGDPTFGATIAAGPTDLMFNESGVDVFIDELLNFTTGYVGFIKNEITTSPWAAFGSGNVMHTNNAVATFELEAIPTDSVCLDFLDFGGFESLTVNGDRYESPNGYGELTGAPAVLGGVTVQVIGSPIIQMTSTGLNPVGFNGRIVLYGNVNKLEIGGQEFWIDNLCISEGEPTAPEVPGCTYEGADNYDAEANTDDGSCILPEVNPCPTDIDADGVTDTQDLLTLLSNFSMTCDE